MSKLINMSEDLKHAKVLLTHEFLLDAFNLFDTLDFSFANTDDCMLNIVTELGQTVVLGICILALC